MCGRGALRGADRHTRWGLSSTEAARGEVVGHAVVRARRRGDVTTPTRAVHLTELRGALAAAYAAAGRLAPAYTDAAVTPGVTAMRSAHLQELRAAVVGLEEGLGAHAPGV